MTQKLVLLIIGMHRSGTSAVSGLCSHLGLDCGRTLMAANAANPKGFWENQLVVDAHDRLLCKFDLDWDSISPLPDGFFRSEAASRCVNEIVDVLTSEFDPSSNWVVKDPRLCLLFPLWEQVLKKTGRDCRVLLVLRHPEEIAASLIRRDHHSNARAFQLITRHSLAALRDTSKSPRLAVTYETVLQKGAIGFAHSLEQGFPGLFERQIDVGKVGNLICNDLRHEVTRQSQTDFGAAFEKLQDSSNDFIDEHALGEYEKFLAEDGSDLVAKLPCEKDELKAELDDARARAVLYKGNYLGLKREFLRLKKSAKEITPENLIKQNVRIHKSSQFENLLRWCWERLRLKN